MLLITGCRDEPASPVNVQMVANQAEILSTLIENNFQTSLTFHTDYKEAIAFIKSTDITEKLSLTRIRTLLLGNHSVFNRLRNFLSNLKPNDAFNPPILIAKYLLFCRFLRNAAHVKSLKCKQKIVREASETMRKRKIFIASTGGKSSTFSVIKKICVGENLSENCPEYAFKAILALNAIAVNRASRRPSSFDKNAIPKQNDPNDTSESDFRGIVTNIISLGENYEKNHEKIGKYLKTLIEIASEVLEPPLAEKCTDEVVDRIIIRMNELYKQIQPILE